MLMGYRPLDSLLRHIRRIAPPPGGAVKDDGALIERFLALKDETAFETLLQRHGPMVLGVCRRILGVLQAMFVSKLKLTAVVLLSVGILGVGALTYPRLAGQQPDPKPAVASQPPPDKNEQEYPKLAALTKERAKAILNVNHADRLKVLLMDRFDAANSEVEARWNRYLAGKETLDIILGASLRLLEAERELSGKKADQIDALENQLKRMRELEKINRL